MWGDPYYWYYYPSWSYYWYWRSSLEVTSEPGYWAEHRYLVVETCLYDNRTDRLVWTAKSETIEDAEFDALAGSIVGTVARQLAAKRLVVAPEDQPRGAASITHGRRGTAIASNNDESPNGMGLGETQ